MSSEFFREQEAIFGEIDPFGFSHFRQICKTFEESGNVPEDTLIPALMKDAYQTGIKVGEQLGREALKGDIHRLLGH